MKAEDGTFAWTDPPFLTLTSRDRQRARRHGSLNLLLQRTVRVGVLGFDASVNFITRLEPVTTQGNDTIHPTAHTQLPAHPSHTRMTRLDSTRPAQPHPAHTQPADRTSCKPHQDFPWLPTAQRLVRRCVPLDPTFALVGDGFADAAPRFPGTDDAEPVHPAQDPTVTCGLLSRFWPCVVHLPAFITSKGPVAGAWKRASGVSDAVFATVSKQQGFVGSDARTKGLARVPMAHSRTELRTLLSRTPLPIGGSTTPDGTAAWSRNSERASSPAAGEPQRYLTGTSMSLALL